MQFVQLVQFVQVVQFVQLVTCSIYCFVTDQSSSHEFQKISTLTNKYIPYYKDLLNSGEDRVTMMCSLSKDAWRKLDDEEEKCNKWIQEVDSMRETQVG